MPSRPRTPASFVERHGLWTEDQARKAKAVEQAIKKHKLELVRFSFADQHGVLRGKVTVLPGLPPYLAQGLFAKPREYDAVLRLSTLPGLCWMTTSLPLAVSPLRLSAWKAPVCRVARTT